MSRILLVSDIHGNLAALRAVLRDAEKNGAFDTVWSLGDTVGYGPQPSECLLMLKQASALAVVGNHELAALGLIPKEDFNPYARQAAEWTGAALSDEAREYAESLPLKLVSGDFTLLHGSPRDPIWEYITSTYIAEETVEHLETRNCANGHTHSQASFLVSDGNHESPPLQENAVYLAPNAGRWFVNPGSVGQPRDGDPRAAYAILDDETNVLQFHRVVYPIAETQNLMEKAGLPSMLSERLAYGY